MLKKVPHTYTIVFSIIIICAILTWIIPGGEYARESVDVNGVERTVIVNDSFHEVAKSPQTWQVFSALFNGFEKQAGIIAFILIIGGTFWIMNNSKAIDVVWNGMTLTGGVQNAMTCTPAYCRNAQVVVVPAA